MFYFLISMLVTRVCLVYKSLVGYIFVKSVLSHKYLMLQYKIEGKKESSDLDKPISNHMHSNNLFFSLSPAEVFIIQNPMSPFLVMEFYLRFYIFLRHF